jgi:hypothetical protein
MDLTEVPLNVPETVYSFHMYLDMITRNKIWDVHEGYKFNIMTFKIFVLDQTDQMKELFQISNWIDFDEIISNTNNEPALHTGNVRVGIEVETIENYTQSHFQSTTNIIESGIADENNILTKPDAFIPTPETEEFEYFSLLSPQPFKFIVNKL